MTIRLPDVRARMLAELAQARSYSELFEIEARLLAEHPGGLGLTIVEVLNLVNGIYPSQHRPAYGPTTPRDIGPRVA